MLTTIGRLAWLSLLVLPAVAEAQSAGVFLGDPDPPAWEVAGHVGWLHVDRSAISPDWNRWSDAATAGVTVDRFIGRHWKVGGDAATSASALVYSQRYVSVPDARTPIVIQQQQLFRTTTVGAGAEYQVFDNRWFHPVVGAGVEATRELRRIETPAYVYPLPVPADVHGDPIGTTVTWRTRPFAAAGFKWYVAERAFIRSELRATVGGNGVSQVSWRSGVGVDF